MQKLLFLFALVLGFSTCKVKPPTDNTGDAATCTEIAYVRDMQGLDGCTFLLELENGERLLPVEMPVIDFKFANNLLVKIAYEEVKDAVSVCMAENKSVKVTCIENLGMTGGVRPGKPSKTPCEKLNGAYDADWMKKLLMEIQPRLVERYDYIDGYAYMLVSRDKIYIYDCQGTKLCEGNETNCSTIISDMKNAYVIWKVDN